LKAAFQTMMSKNADFTVDENGVVHDCRHKPGVNAHQVAPKSEE